LRGNVIDPATVKIIYVCKLSNKRNWEQLHSLAFDEADTFNDEGFYNSSIAQTVVLTHASATLGLHFEKESNPRKKNGSRSF
jgi:hypothetical protein